MADNEETNYGTMIEAMYSEFNDVKTSFLLRVTKANDLKAVKEPKLYKKEELLLAKASRTISRAQEIDLENMQEKDKILDYKNSSEQTSRSKSRRDIQEAKEHYDLVVASAKAKYESTIASAKQTFESKQESSLAKLKDALTYWDSQTKQMFDKQEHAYQSKKKLLSEREKQLEVDRKFLEKDKSTAEYTNEREMREIAKKLRSIYRNIEISQEQLEQARIPNTLSTPRPLPIFPTHPIMDEITTKHNKPEKPVALPCPCGRMCPEVPIIPGCKDLVFKCWAVEEQFRRSQLRTEEHKEQRELRRKVKQQEELPLTQAVEKVERKEEKKEQDEEWEPLETEEEIAEAKKQFEEKYVKKEQPPLTQFQGLPRPDAAPKKFFNVKKLNNKPIGMLKYATPVEIV